MDQVTKKEFLSLAEKGNIKVIRYLGWYSYAEERNASEAYRVYDFAPDNDEFKLMKSKIKFIEGDRQGLSEIKQLAIRGYAPALYVYGIQRMKNHRYKKSGYYCILYAAKKGNLWALRDRYWKRSIVHPGLLSSILSIAGWRFVLEIAWHRYREHWSESMVS